MHIWCQFNIWRDDLFWCYTNNIIRCDGIRCIELVYMQEKYIQCVRFQFKTNIIIYICMYIFSINIKIKVSVPANCLLMFHIDRSGKCYIFTNIVIFLSGISQPLPFVTLLIIITSCPLARMILVHIFLRILYRRIQRV